MDEHYLFIMCIHFPKSFHLMQQLFDYRVLWSSRISTHDLQSCYHANKALLAIHPHPYILSFSLCHNMSKMQNGSYVLILSSIHVLEIAVYNILNGLDAADHYCHMDLQRVFVANKRTLQLY